MDTPNPDSIMYPWDTQAHNYHNVGVQCDLAELSFSEKQLIRACLYQESTLLNYLPDGNPVKCVNKLPDGTVGSTDWGIAQINDYYHIGEGKDFPSVEYVLANPQTAVHFMITMYQHGLLKQWVSYSSGAYKKWLLPNSPMLALANQQ